MKYTIVIQWSYEDNCFVVFLPEFEDVMQPVTHSNTYQKAFNQAMLWLKSSDLIQESLNPVNPDTYLGFISQKLIIKIKKNLRNV